MKFNHNIEDEIEDKIRAMMHKEFKYAHAHLSSDERTSIHLLESRRKMVSKIICVKNCITSILSNILKKYSSTSKKGDLDI